MNSSWFNIACRLHNRFDNSRSSTFEVSLGKEGGGGDGAGGGGDGAGRGGVMGQGGGGAHCGVWEWFNSACVLLGTEFSIQYGTSKVDD